LFIGFIVNGKGADIAMDVAKMTIISSDLTKIPAAIRLSGYTVGTIRQNLFWAITVYNKYQLWGLYCQGDAVSERGKRDKRMGGGYG
jgi:hypothetical protein